MALAHIRDGAGTHFDPDVVEALTRIVDGWGIRRPAETGTAEVAWEAAETCHELDDDRLASV
jgi:HD-GYP domain-containing protein (c-di-GMP phosphodiesterase class II)